MANFTPISGQLKIQSPKQYIDGGTSDHIKFNQQRSPDHLAEKYTALLNKNFEEQTLIAKQLKG